MSVEGRGWVTRVEIDLVNWQQEEPADFGGRRQLSMGGTSRMSREAQVRICERLGVQFPGPTRRQCWRATRSRISRSELIADDDEGVILPTRSFTWARGRPTGGGTASLPGFGFDLKDHIGPIDSAMPEKTHAVGFGIVLCSRNQAVAG